MRTTPSVGRVLALVGLLVMTGCASWQKCENETIPKWAQPTIGHIGPPDWGAGSLVLGGLVMGVCAAVVQTRTVIEQSEPLTQPSPVVPNVPNNEESKED